MSIKFKSENIQKYQDLANSIKENLQVEGSNIKEKESHSAYYNNLPDGITKDQVETISKYNGKFITAAHVAIGDLASDIFKKDKSIDTVEAEVGYFGKNDSINVTVNRSKTYNNFLAKEGEPKEITKQLVMSTTVETSSAKGVSLKAVKESMSEEFANNFKS